MRKTSIRQLLLSTAALSALAAIGMTAPANAADLAARPYTKAPPMIAAVYDWTGFYIGANGGYASQRDCRTRVDLGLALGCHDASGGVAGGQIGYRWQSAGWVFGLEAQGDWADLSGGTQNLGNALNSLHSRTNAFGLFTGQLGYAWNNTLLYVKGGAAVTNTRHDFISNATGLVTATSGDSTHWNATVGAGIEYGFTPNWSVAFEYDHIFSDRRDRDFTTPAGVPLVGRYSTGGEMDIATVRVNYRWGGPVIPKY